MLFKHTHTHTHKQTALHAKLPSVWLPYTTLDHLQMALRDTPPRSLLKEVSFHNVLSYIAVAVREHQFLALLTVVGTGRPQTPLIILNHI